MADVTISSLPQGTPSGNSAIPFSTGSNTLRVPVSAIFQNTGNVGIGTSSPNGTFAVVRDGGNGIILQSSASSPNTSIILGTNYNNTGRVVIAASSEVTTRPGLSIVTGDTERLTIDNQGNVGIGTTTPTAKLDVNGDVTISGSLRATGLDRVYAALTSGPYVYPNGIVKWNAVLLNTNNSYNSSTGYFTATKSGIYRVSAYWISSGAGDYFIRRNDSNYAVAHNNHNDTWDNSSITCLVSLNIGDTIGFFYQQASGYSGGLYGGAYNGYSIEQLP